MTDDNETAGSWQIFEFSGPGPHFPRWAVAQSLRRALTIAVEDETHLDAGLALVVWNRTEELTRIGHAMSTQTICLLNEGREGLVFYDRRIGWERIDRA